MKKFLLAGTALLTFVSGSAMAADMRPAPAPAPVYTKAPMMPVFSWTGCYIGVEGGAAWGRSHHEDATGVLITNDYDVTGGLIGGELGCNYQVSSWLFGLEGDLSWVTKKGSASDIAPFNTLFVSGTKENWLGTGRARLGFLATPQFLLYATGGFAAAGVEADVTPPGVATLTETQTRWGWTVGGGGEYAFTNNWSIKAEYLFVQLQNASYFATPVPTPAGLVVTRGNVPLNNNIVRAGLNYKF